LGLGVGDRGQNSQGKRGQRRAQIAVFHEKTDTEDALAVLPDSAWAFTVARLCRRTTTVLAGIRADRTTDITFPGAQGAQWLIDAS
jgi:hypothetical protein